MTKAPPPEALNRIVRWVILLFFAYLLLSGSFHLPQKGNPRSLPQQHNTAAVAAKEPQASTANKGCGSESGLSDFSVLASTLMPSTRPIIRIQDTKQGTGEGAVCGQNATLRFAYALENGTMIYSDMDHQDSAQVAIGDGALLKGMEQGMLGMKPGGERTMAFPSPLAFGNVKDPSTLLGSDQFASKMGKLKGAIVLGKVSLIALSPELPRSSLPLRVIDHRGGGGARAQCGDTVHVRMTLWKLDGSKLFSTNDTGKLLAFTLGMSQAPFGIEQSMMDMSEGGQRTVIVPAAYAKPLISDEDASDTNNPLLSLPKETMLAEIHLEHIGEDALNVPSGKRGGKDTKSPSSAPDGKKPADTDD